MPAGSGTRRTVNGIDIWQSGQPNRPFHILGTFENSRPSEISSADLDNRLVALAKANGADAIMFLNKDRTFVTAAQSAAEPRQDLILAAARYGPRGEFGLLSRMLSGVLEGGEPVPLTQLGFDFSPTPMRNFLDPRKYFDDKNGVYAVYLYESKNRGPDAFVVAYKDSNKFVTDLVSRRWQTYSDQGQWLEAKPISPKITKQWVRSDGKYYAVTFPKEGMNLFILANSEKVPLTAPQ